jgi:hypothetical protein
MQRYTREPPAEKWPEILRSNRELLNCFPHDMRDQMALLRQRMVREAQAYTQYLQEVAHARGVELPAPFIPKGCVAESTPIIMSGHQPLVYHDGLLEKERALSNAAVGPYLAVHVVVDTDAGDGSHIRLPEAAEGELRFRNLYLSNEGGLHLNQRIKTQGEVTSTFSEVEKCLSGLGVPYSRERVAHTADLYRKLADIPAAEAHSIVRWGLEGRRYLEIPLSVLLRTPEALRVIGSWAKDTPYFSERYNEVLDAYRIAHKIKNAANPFPNVEVTERGAELPMWICKPRLGERKPARALMQGKIELDSEEFLALRGSLTTLLLRGWCSDLFIHGRGGAKYDPLVDEFAARYLGVQLPGFVVVSSDRFLFADRMRALEAAERIQKEYKQIVSHTERFFGANIFNADELNSLTDLTEQRRQLLGQMALASNPALRSEVAHKLNQVNREVRAILDNGSVKAALKELSSPAATLAAIKCRGYPFFVFPSTSVTSRP